MIGNFFEFDRQKQNEAMSELIGMFVSAAMMENVRFMKARRKDNGEEVRVCGVQMGEAGMAFPVEVIVRNPAEIYEFFNHGTGTWEDLLNDGEAEAVQVTVGEAINSMISGANAKAEYKRQAGEPRYIRHYAAIHTSESRQPVTTHVGISMYAVSLEDAERFPELRGVELVAVWTEDGNFRVRTTTQEEVEKDIAENANGEIVMGARG